VCVTQIAGGAVVCGADEMSAWAEWSVLRRHGQPSPGRHTPCSDLVKYECRNMASFSNTYCN